MDKEKVYITRDEISDFVWIWRKPLKGNHAPHKLSDCDIVCYQREDIEEADYYYFKDFKKKFNITIRQKTKRCVQLPVALLNNEDYKLVSNDKDRKK